MVIIFKTVQCPSRNPFVNQVFVVMIIKIYNGEFSSMSQSLRKSGLRRLNAPVKSIAELVAESQSLRKSGLRRRLVLANKKLIISPTIVAIPS